MTMVKISIVHKLNLKKKEANVNSSFSIPGKKGDSLQEVTSASWAINSEPVQAQGIITFVKYSPPNIKQHMKLKITAEQRS